MEPRDDLPGGVIAVKTTGVANNGPGGDLYAVSQRKLAKQPATITAIPYYANANRGPVDMAVWLPVEI
jgi:DUF1680 family protein